jgi:predicted ATPase
MQLQALGGLRLEPSSFTRPKPLLLLTYLAIEGPQQRKHLAELFWQDGNRMKSLSMALTLLRQGAGEVAQVDAKQVHTTLASDVRALLGALDKSNWEEAAHLYQGAFLEGVVLGDWSSELEEWVYKTREYLAERVQHALITLAENAAKEQNFTTAVDFAERAYKLSGLGGTEVINLKRLYALLCAGNSLLAPDVRKEAEGYGVTLRLTTEEARATFTQAVEVTSSLPRRGTSFVGRDVELTELATLLSARNISLLTVLGTAGVGKTRLALQLAQEQQTLGTFMDGVYFIPLESLSDPSLIPSSLLSHLGLNQRGKIEPIQQLIEFFADKHSLVVLDNFEHLTAGAALLSQLLSNCPNLKLLVTSRETLKLEEEHVVMLEGLSFPPLSSSDIALSDAVFSDAVFSDAVQLFKERAQQVKVQFELTENLAAVIQICHLVEGLPLGIELAASWVRLMPCTDIAHEIEWGLELLSSTSKNIPERRRSLKAAFEYSWKLLTSKEQETLRNLSVFHNGFGREAASDVAGATIPMLASLVDKSLLRVAPNGRYTFHSLLQHFSGEKLAANDNEQSSVQEKHSKYYLRLLEKVKQQMRGGGQKEALRQLEEETENIFKAWSWASAVGFFADMLKSVGVFKTLFTERGRHQEAERFFAQSIKQLEATQAADKRLIAHLKGDQAWSLYSLSNFSQAAELAKECLEVSRCFQDELGQFKACNVLACIMMDLGRLEEAKDYSQQSLTHARAENDVYLMMPALINLGSLENERGNLADAEKHYREALVLCRETRDFIYMTSVMNNLGFILKETNRLQEATRLLEESLAISRPINLRTSQMYAVVTLAMIYSQFGQVEKSIEYAREGLMIAEESGAKRQQAFIAELMGQFYKTLHKRTKALNYFMQSLKIAKDAKDTEMVLTNIINIATDIAVPEKRWISYLKTVHHHPNSTAGQKEQVRHLLSELTEETMPSGELSSAESLDWIVLELLEEHALPLRQRTQTHPS